MGTKKLTVIATSSASLESIENSVISVVNQRRAKDQANNYIGDVFAVQHKAQFYVVDDDFISTVKSDGNVLKTDYVTSTKLGEELAKIPSSGTITLDENRVNELIDNKITTLDLDSKFSSKVSVDDVYTKSEIDGKLATVSAGGNVNLDGYATTDQLNLALSGKADKTMVEGLVTKIEVNEEIAKLATKDEITPISEKIVVIEESIEGLASKDEIVVLATKEELTPINSKLADIEALVPNFATSSDLAGFANMSDVRLELEAKADVSVIDTLATKAELGNYALKSEVPTGVTVDDEQVARAVNENSKIQELSSAVANMASNLQGATYPQVVATMKYCGYDVPSDLTIYDPYNLKDRSGDANLTLEIDSTYNNSYATLQNLKLIGSGGKVYVMAKYHNPSLTSATLYFVEKEIVPKLDSEVEKVESNYEKQEGEIVVNIKTTSTYAGGYDAYRIGLDESPGWCSAGNAVGERVEISIKDFIPAEISVRTGYEDSTHLITKCSFTLSCGELMGESLIPNEGNERRDMVISLKDIDVNSKGEGFVELAKAWNIAPIAYVPNYSIGSIANLVDSVSSENPFVFLFRGLDIQYDSYGTGVSNIEFFNESGERLYPKYAYLSNGDNEATYILTPKKDEKITELATAPEGYVLLEGEKKVIAIRYSEQYSSSYGFEEFLLYTAPSAYDHEYLVGNNGNGLVNVEFRCDFVPSKLQYIQSPYGHGKATGYEAVVDGVQVATAMYTGGTYDYEVLDFANARVKLPKGSFNLDYEAVNRSDMGSEFDNNQSKVSIDINKLTSTITVTGDINNLQTYASSNPDQGSHKWVGVGIKTGFDSVEGISVNGSVLDKSYDETAKVNGLSSGSFVFWFKADTDGSGRTLSLSKDGVSKDIKVVFKQVDTPVNTQGSSTVSPTSPLPDGESTNNQNFSDISDIIVVE